MSSKNWATSVAAVGVLLVAGTACDNGGGTSDAGKASPATSKPTRTIEERESDYAAALPSDLVDHAGVRQLTTVGYDVCDQLKSGRSDGSVLNGLKDRDPIWLGLYGKDLFDAAKTNLCEG